MDQPPPVPTRPEAADQSADLVRRAQLGDRAAFDALIRRSADRLAHLVRTRMSPALRRHEDSADVVQSVLREAVADLPAFEYRGEGSFVRWLAGVVRHKVAHRVRDQNRDKRDAARTLPIGDGSAAQPPSREPGPVELAVGHEAEGRYHLALERLDEGERELLLLYLELGCSHGEIAEALSITSTEAVRKRIARALAKLQAAMGGGGGAVDAGGGAPVRPW